VRYLYFLQVTQNAPVLPFPEEVEEEGGEEESSNGSAGQAAAASAAAAEAQRQAAKSTMETSRAIFSARRKGAAGPTIRGGG